MTKSGVREQAHRPPAGWKARVVGHRAFQQGNEPTPVAQISGKVVPAQFMLAVTPPDMGDVAIVLQYEVVDGQLINSALVTEGIDAVRAADVLRKGMTFEDWGRFAVNFISMELLVDQLVLLGDAGTLATILGISVSDAEARLAELRDINHALGSREADAGWAAAATAARSRFDQVGAKFLLDEVPVRRTHRRNGITPEHLQAVAVEYRRAVSEGVPPTKAVAERFEASHSTAARWVKLARDAGELGPAAPGRSGEAGPAVAESE